MPDLDLDPEPPTDYETAKEWELDATIRAFFSIKDDLEPLPLFAPDGRQVGVGVGLLWTIGPDGQLQWILIDESHRCSDEEEVGVGNREDGWWDEYESRYRPVRDIDGLDGFDGLASRTPY